MNFIRNRKTKDPCYSSEEVHCMHGMDADLIMLGSAVFFFFFDFFQINN